MKLGRPKVVLAHLIDIWVLFPLPLHSQALIGLVGLQQIGRRGRKTINHKNRRSSSLCVLVYISASTWIIFIYVCVSGGSYSAINIGNDDGQECDNTLKVLTAC